MCRRRGLGLRIDQRMDRRQSVRRSRCDSVHEVRSHMMPRPLTRHDARKEPMSAEPAHSIARALRDAGVKTIFGLPGGGTNLDIIAAAQSEGIRFILAHTEAAACMMAASYGRMTGTVGVAVVTRGPGFMSAANGIAQTSLDRYPLMVLSDVVSSRDSPRIAHQRVDQVAVARHTTKWNATVGSVNAAAVVAAAIQEAMEAPAGAVHLAIDPTIPGDGPASRPPARVKESASVTTTSDLVLAGRRPVVLVGLDAARHAHDVRFALRDLPCPILVTYQAKGTVPESWPTFAGLFTNT